MRFTDAARAEIAEMEGEDPHAAVRVSPRLRGDGEGRLGTEAGKTFSQFHGKPPRRGIAPDAEYEREPAQTIYLGGESVNNAMMLENITNIVKSFAPRPDALRRTCSHSAAL